MRIFSVVGARPNFVEIAPLLREMARCPGIESYVVHTEQHKAARSIVDILTNCLGSTRAHATSFHKSAANDQVLS